MKIKDWTFFLDKFLYYDKHPDSNAKFKQALYFSWVIAFEQASCLHLCAYCWRFQTDYKYFGERRISDLQFLIDIMRTTENQIKISWKTIIGDKERVKEKQEFQTMIWAWQKQT